MAKPKELWQTLKSLGLPKQKEFSFEYMFDKQKWFIIRLTVNSGKFLKILPLISGKPCVNIKNFRIQSVNNYYNKCNVQRKVTIFKN